MEVATIKVLFIYPNIYTPYAFSPAIQILSSVLKSAGHKTELLHLNPEYGAPDDDRFIIKYVEKIRPDLIAFTATSFEYKRADAIAAIIKKGVNNPPPIIIGGVHASIKPEDYPHSNFDAFCVGEGEKLILALAAGKIKPRGLLYGDTVDDLGSLPQRDWQIIDTNKILNYKKGWLNLGISRGCPFSCTFCAAPLLRKIHRHRRPRRMPIADIMSELTYLANNYPVKVFNFDDDLFTSSKKWGLEFADAYKENIWLKYRIPFAIESRVDTINSELLSALKESGCREIQFGVETGSSRLLEFVKKRVTVEQIRRAFAVCDRLNINTYAYIIVGIPGETHSAIMQTFDLLAKSKPRLIRPTFLCPVYGTELYEYCRENKLLKEDGVSAWNFQYPLKIKTMKEAELMKYWYLFPWYINAAMKIDIYQQAIDKFKAAAFADLNHNRLPISKILKIDAELAAACGPTNHYRYQPENGGNEDLSMRFNRFVLAN